MILSMFSISCRDQVFVALILFSAFILIAVAYISPSLSEDTSGED